MYQILYFPKSSRAVSTFLRGIFRSFNNSSKCNSAKNNRQQFSSIRRLFHFLCKNHYAKNSFIYPRSSITLDTTRRQKLFYCCGYFYPFSHEMFRSGRENYRCPESAVIKMKYDDVKQISCRDLIKLRSTLSLCVNN